MYYALVLLRGWAKKEMMAIAWCPLVVVVGLAFSGTPFYDWYVYGCHLLPPPFGNLWKVLIFAMIPVGFPIFSITMAFKFATSMQLCDLWVLVGDGGCLQVQMSQIDDGIDSAGGNSYTIANHCHWPSQLKQQRIFSNIFLEVFSTSLCTVYQVLEYDVNYNFHVYVPPLLEVKLCRGISRLILYLPTYR